jgi:hypothetical protein
MRRIMRWIRRLLVVALLFLGGPVAVLAVGDIDLNHNWRTGSRAAAGLAPDPAATPDAVVQVYAARSLGLKGILGVHSWIAVKPAGAAGYTVYEVLGWRVHHGLPALRVSHRAPDARWFGYLPKVLAELRGAPAVAAIADVDAAVRSYPFADSYRMWPGPNSNTFTAYVARLTPGLRLDLPPTAVGKDYLAPGRFVAAAPSGTGLQLSLFGLMGLTAAVEEGIELNLLGLTLGLDPLDLAIKLPGIGRIGG